MILTAALSIAGLSSWLNVAASLGIIAIPVGLLMIAILAVGTSRLETLNENVDSLVKNRYPKK